MDEEKKARDEHEAAKGEGGRTFVGPDGDYRLPGNLVGNIDGVLEEGSRRAKKVVAPIGWVHVSDAQLIWVLWRLLAHLWSFVRQTPLLFNAAIERQYRTIAENCLRDEKKRRAEIEHELVDARRANEGSSSARVEPDADALLAESDARWDISCHGMAQQPDDLRHWGDLRIQHRLACALRAERERAEEGADWGKRHRKARRVAEANLVLGEQHLRAVLAHGWPEGTTGPACVRAARAFLARAPRARTGRDGPRTRSRRIDATKKKGAKTMDEKTSADEGTKATTGDVYAGHRERLARLERAVQIVNGIENEPTDCYRDRLRVDADWSTGNCELSFHVFGSGPGGTILAGPSLDELIERGHEILREHLAERIRTFTERAERFEALAGLRVPRPGDEKRAPETGAGTSYLRSVESVRRDLNALFASIVFRGSLSDLATDCAETVARWIEEARQEETNVYERERGERNERKDGGKTMSRVTNTAKNPGIECALPGMIEASERRGQRELVDSTVLPADLNDDRREDFERLGFVFGEPVEDDPLFLSATLPEGWKKRLTDHSMWSEIVDEKDRPRVLVFYKAAFYDRGAHMELVRRYEVRAPWGDETPGPKTALVVDRKTGAVLHEAKREDGPEKWQSACSNARDAANAWLVANVPNHRDPMAWLEDGPDAPETKQEGLRTPIFDPADVSHVEALRYVCARALGPRHETDALVRRLARVLDEPADAAFVVDALLRAKGVDVDGPVHLAEVAAYHDHDRPGLIVWLSIPGDWQEFHVPMRDVRHLVAALLDATTAERALAAMKEARAAEAQVADEDKDGTS